MSSLGDPSSSVSRMGSLFSSCTLLYRCTCASTQFIERTLQADFGADLDSFGHNFTRLQQETAVPFFGRHVRPHDLLEPIMISPGVRDFSLSNAVAMIAHIRK